jgi:long chain fatty acid CoA FadD26
MTLVSISQHEARDAALLLPAAVLDHAAQRPGATAYLFHRNDRPPEELTYAALARHAAGVADRLRLAGCSGKRVALIAGHGPEFVTGLLGAHLAGCAAVPVALPASQTLRQRARAILAEADCAVILAGAEADLRSETLAEIRPAGVPVLEIADIAPSSALPNGAMRPADVAIVQYTSGSTSTPRGVIVTHGALAAQQQAILRAVGPCGEERVVTWLPPEHDMGLMGGLLFNLWRGQSTYVLPPAAFVRRPVLWLEAISRWGGTISVSPDFGYDLCVRAIPEARRAGLDLSRWRVALNGAEPVRPETMDRFAAAFGPAGFDARAFLPCYGLAEATLLVTGARGGAGARTAWFDAAALERGEVRACPPGQGRRLASSGPARTSGGVQIVSAATGTLCAADRTGEIWIAGDSLGSGYLARPEDSHATFAARLPDGTGPFLRSGDIGFLWQDELFVTGRIKDIVLWHGRTLHASDLEQALQRAERQIRHGRIAVCQASDGAVSLMAEVSLPQADESQLATIAAELWARLLAMIGVEAAQVLLVRPGTLLWTSSGKLRRRASLARAMSEPDCVRIDWSPDRAGTRRARAQAVRDLALAHEGQAVPAQAFLRFFLAWIAAETGTDPDLIDPDLAWSDQGLDSLALTQLALDLETATGRPIATETLLDLPDPRALASALAGT